MHHEIINDKVILTLSKTSTVYRFQGMQSYITLTFNSEVNWGDTLASGTSIISMKYLTMITVQQWGNHAHFTMNMRNIFSEDKGINKCIQKYLKQLREDETI